MNGIGFYFFGQFIAYYGLMIVIGILVNIPIALVQIRRFHLNVNNLMIIIGFCALFGIVSAKIMYLIISFNNIDWFRLLEPIYLAELMSGGLVFLGGILGVLTAVLFCQTMLHIPVQPYIQACTGCIPLEHNMPLEE